MADNEKRIPSLTLDSEGGAAAAFAQAPVPKLVLG